MADVCANENIGLYFNAVGHTINRNEDNELMAWKEIFAKPAIKYVSCRDEIGFFKKVCSYAELVCCSAAYSAEIYNMKKDYSSNTIGSGVIRPDAFEDYGIVISYEKLVDFYKQLIDKLFEIGYEVKLFTNGLTRDYIFGEKIAEASGREDILIERPERIEELLNTISSFKGVIVSRMHAAIIAYSFDIPALCLCWNNKHKEFMKYAGVEERAIYPKNFSADYVVEVLKNAIGSGWPEEQKETYRTTALKSVDEIVSIIMAREAGAKLY